MVQARRSNRRRGAGNAILAQADPPLPEMQLNLPFDVTYPTTSASAVVNQTASLAGNTVAVNVTTPLVGVHRENSEAWASAAENSFTFDSLSVGSAQVFQGLTLLGSGAVTAAPASAATPASASHQRRGRRCQRHRRGHPVAARAGAA